jgi:hypothetical protein
MSTRSSPRLCSQKVIIAEGHNQQAGTRPNSRVGGFETADRVMTNRPSSAVSEPSTRARFRCSALNITQQGKVDVPKSNTTIIWTPTFEWYAFRCRSKKWRQTDMCFRTDRIVCPKYLNHSKFDRRHNSRDLYGHFMSMRIFILRTNKIFIRASKIVKQMAIGTIKICQSSCSNCVFHIVCEVGPEGKVSI